MPQRKTVGKQESRTVDPVSAFRWCRDGVEPHPLGEPAYRTIPEARKAWERSRRLVWAMTYRFSLPTPAELWDGLTLDGLELVRQMWNHDVFDLGAVLTALQEDREHLSRFAKTRGATPIQDYLSLLTLDLDRIEDTARGLATY